jgi:hypothetical protein
MILADACALLAFYLSDLRRPMYLVTPFVRASLSHHRVQADRTPRL